MFTLLNLEVEPGQLIWPRVVQQIGTAFMFAPLSVAAFMYLPKELRGSAAGIFAVLRNEGGSAGTSLGKTLVQRRLPLHTDRLGENFNLLNPTFNEALSNGERIFYGITGDPEASRQMALSALDSIRQEQAASLAYFDAFWIFGVLALLIVPLALFMKRSVAEPGQHLAAE